MATAYFKDRFMPEEQCVVPVSDRSFRFGDGMFETWLVADGNIYDYEGHLKRLNDGLKAIRIPFDTSKLQTLCNELVAKNNLDFGYVRVTISRGEGSGAVGYLPVDAEPTVLIQAVAKEYPAFSSLSLWKSSYPAVAIVPSKTNSSLVYALTMMEAKDHGCDNGILIDAHGHICETGSGNLFWIKSDVLYTPSLDLPLVPGTMRAKVLALWTGKVEQGKYTLEDLLMADEIFMTNVATIVAAVTEVKPLGIKLPAGAHTKALRDAMDRDILGAEAAKKLAHG